MKNLLSTLQKLAALIFLLILSDSLYSQNVISSVNVSTNAASISKSLTNDMSNSIDLSKKSNNWMFDKNYLDNSSHVFNYKIMFVLTEKVYESENRIESWMLDDSRWILSIEEMYELKQIETWMLDENFWIIDEDVNKDSIKDWMLDNTFWVIVN
ncbi:MAG TPA: hypothetical protein DCG75_01370 [Bacteroidales bacterium]|nr:hypothetical protein [Bacteroidales bacterium]